MAISDKIESKRGETSSMPARTYEYSKKLFFGSTI